jgi:hypothetical protein
VKTGTTFLRIGSTLLSLWFYIEKCGVALQDIEKCVEELKKETEGKREKRKVPGSAIRRLIEVLERCGGESECMTKDQLLGLHEKVFGYKSEKPLYGVINRAVRHGRAYTIETREGVMICSRRVHERKLLSILEDIYIRWRLGQKPEEAGRVFKKFEGVRIPFIELEKHLLVAYQHILCYPEVFNIVSFDYNAVLSIAKSRGLKPLKEKLPLEILEEASESYRVGILKMCIRKAGSLLKDLNLYRDPQGLGESLYNVVRALTFTGSEELEHRLNAYAREIKDTYQLPDERLAAEALREIYNHLKDIILLHHEIDNERSKRSAEFRETVFKIIEESLIRGELKGVCFICGRVKYNDMLIERIRSILEPYSPLPSSPSRLKGWVF